MKKVKLYVFLSGCFPAFIVFILFLGLFSGGITGVTMPLAPPATEEQAYKYQYIGSELGVPWDMVLLADAILAEQNDESGIEKYNPILTALKFCIIREEVEVYEEITKEVTTEDGGTETKVVGGSWKHARTNYYEADYEILQYIDMKKDTITFESASQLVSEINKTAQSKSGSQTKYTATIMVNQDYEKVLKKYVKLNDDYVKKVLELHEENYLQQLYGSSNKTGDFEGELPDLVVGDVTRMDLAKVAVSLINHPYALGGKYFKKGIPDCAIDCSGFVDWVYIQCFGKVVSAGKIPDGIPVSGTAMQFYACAKINESELKVGDLGFLQDPALLGGRINHVGIYIGKIDGQNAFIHCAGRAYGYADRPTGRVGISVSGRYNNKNNVLGTTFSPAMKGCTFRYFRRPNFKFIEE